MVNWIYDLETTSKNYLKGKKYVLTLNDTKPVLIWKTQCIKDPHCGVWEGDVAALHIFLERLFTRAEFVTQKLQFYACTAVTYRNSS